MSARLLKNPEAMEIHSLELVELNSKLFMEGNLGG